MASWQFNNTGLADWTLDASLPEELILPRTVADPDISGGYRHLSVVCRPLSVVCCSSRSHISKTKQDIPIVRPTVEY